MMVNSKKANRVARSKYVNSLKQYEKSNENMCRSVGVYYSGGVTGKRKYRKLYRESAYKVNKKKTTRISIASCPVPRLVPYNKLMPFIKSIPIGTLFDVKETLCQGMQTKVSGCYRSLHETLIFLAKFYLNKTSDYDLIWFDEPYTFHVALGGDGAPFGKDDTSCAWLISFLNIGRGVLSSNENFLIFGANCSENGLPVKRYIKFLLSEIKTLQQRTFPIAINDNVNVNVKFIIAELPNDMKMLAFLSGELNNSATFFSSFADVSYSSGRSRDGTFGKEENNLWKPWDYKKRLRVVRQVEEEKKKLEKKKIADKTKRHNITELIAKLKSRQEFKPLLEDIIDVAHVEPLHLKNNACALVHRYLLEEVVRISKIPSDNILFSQLPSNCPFVHYVNVLSNKCCLSRLAKKVIKHYNETGSLLTKKFDYRFTGRDSRLFLHNFMFLIDAIEPLAREKTKPQFHIHAIAFFALTLRNCVSLFNRIDISDEQVSELERSCSDFF